MNIKQILKRYVNKRKLKDSGWIDINEERPPANTKILVYGKIIRELREGDIEYGQCVVSTGDYEDGDNNLFGILYSDYYSSECLASHWRIIEDPKNTELWYAN